MPNRNGPWENQTATFIPPKWEPVGAYRLHILITKDDETSYSAIALNLPGVGSCGDTPEEAVENVKEAARAALESYGDSREDVPWKDTSSEVIPFGATQKWIIVHA